MDIKTRIQQEVQKALAALAKSNRIPPADGLKVVVEPAADERFGDYATNVAMLLAKKAGKNPMAIAESVVKEMKSLDTLAKAGVAKPGFINFTLSQEVLGAEIAKILEEGDKYGRQKMGRGKTVVIDYSAPNIAKPMSVGHLRSTVIGDALARIFEFLGYKVVTDNHLGDWGTQFGILLYAYKNFGDKAKVEKDPINELTKLYVDFNEKIKAKPELKEKGKAEFRKLEEGDSENREIWEWFIKVSLAKFQEVYDLLQIRPFDYVNGESFYQDKMKPEVKRLEKLGLLKTGQDGERYVDLEKYNLGRAIIAKADQATIYLTRDLATYHWREKKFKPFLNLYVVGQEQSHHFRQLFKVLELAGYEGVKANHHVAFGLVHLPGGTKMSTRRGQVIALKDLINEAQAKVRKIIGEKNPDLNNPDVVSREVAVGAIKYADLSQKRQTKVSFSWEKMLDFEGRSGPYLQYTHARIESILAKAPAGWRRASFGELADLREQRLIRRLFLFPERVILASRGFYPHYIADYLFTLAGDYNAFYNKLRVLQEKNEAKRNGRLILSTAVAQVLKNGLRLLGLKAPKQM